MPDAVSKKPLHLWLLTTGLLAFGVYLLWQHRLLSAIVEQDKTRLSLLIMALFVATCLYLGGAALRLVRLEQSVLRLLRTGRSADRRAGIEALGLPPGVDGRRLLRHGGGAGQPLHVWLAERAHRGHSLGWFMSESLIRLGLIGTVLGFIMMLGAVYDLQTGEVDTLKDLLASMGGGMQVALHTTLTGIACSLLLNIYCRGLDRCADDLVGRLVLRCLTDDGADDNAADGGKDGEPV